MLQVAKSASTPMTQAAIMMIHSVRVGRHPRSSAMKFPRCIITANNTGGSTDKNHILSKTSRAVAGDGGDGVTGGTARGRGRA